MPSNTNPKRKRGDRFVRAIPRLRFGLVCAVLTPSFALAAGPTPEERAVAFLAREVPKWPVENKCYSCHNNGDGARALYAAKKLGLRVEPSVLKSTTTWLAKPDGWENNGGKAEFSDKKLASIQFAAALLAAMETEALDGKAHATRDALFSAAKKVAAEQDKDGAWRIDADGVLGSPVTYGAALATATSLRVLRRADRESYATRIAAGEEWLMAQKPRAIPDAAAVVLGLAECGTKVERPLAVSLELLAKGQDKTGGWGPYANSAPEPFDTALALLALSAVRQRAGVRDKMARGRKSLVDSQLKDGSWIETTRPPGAESYAQRLSTTGWATLALLATREK
jgi:hypothetical protein